MAQPADENVPPFCLSLFVSDNKITWEVNNNIYSFGYFLYREISKIYFKKTETNYM